MYLQLDLRVTSMFIFFQCRSRRDEPCRLHRRKRGPIDHPGGQSLRAGTSEGGRQEGPERTGPDHGSGSRRLRRRRRVVRITFSSFCDTFS